MNKAETSHKKGLIWAAVYGDFMPEASFEAEKEPAQVVR
jgi:hypothetical protein